MTPAGLFLTFFVFSGIQDAGFSLDRVRREESLDESYAEDVKKQLVAGMKDVRKSAEKAVELNSKAADLASQIAVQAAEIRKTLSVDEMDSRSGSDPDTATEQSTNSNSETSLSQIDAQVNYKLFSARRDFGWVKKIGQRTAEMLQIFSTEGADPVKNRYYEERGGLQKQALQQLIDYQKSLQKMRITLAKLKSLEASFKSATEKDFSLFSEWKTDGAKAVSLVKSFKTDVFLKAYRETEKTDYFVEHAEGASESEHQRSYKGNPFGTKPGNLGSYGIGLGSEYKKLPINTIIREVAAQFQAKTTPTPRSLSLIKCLVKNIFTFLSEVYVCLRDDEEGEDVTPEPIPIPEPEPELEPGFYLPYKMKTNPKFLMARPLVCALRPIFYFILGIITCLLT